MSLQALLEQAVQRGVFPAAQAVVLHHRRILFEGCAGDCGWTTRFDLASLTKVLCTTSLFAALWDQGLLAPEDPLARFLPTAEVARAGARLEDLLFHRSGLPAFRPYFAVTLKSFPRLVEADCPALLRDAARAHALGQVLATAPERPAGTAAVYSDVGFILLGEALARTAGAPLEVAFERWVARRLGLEAAFHRLSAGPRTTPSAPTGTRRPREPAPGQEALWSGVPSAPDVPGRVDDDNAYVLDGVAGHAGLFGTARAVAAFGQAVLEELAGAHRLAGGARWGRLVRRDDSVPGSTRAMGFDTPSPVGSSAGTRLGRLGPLGAVGHTGFTGTSLWIDLDRQLVVALCTNRTLPARRNTALTDFRPRFHDAVIELLSPDLRP